MKHLGGNVTKAAVEAGMERETLHRLLRRYEVDPSQFRS
jgi:transcriptional regulator of acetoin/glycerol metabolism